MHINISQTIQKDSQKRETETETETERERETAITGIIIDVEFMSHVHFLLAS
jgi:hypothetical protein